MALSQSCRPWSNASRSNAVKGSVSRLLNRRLISDVTVGSTRPKAIESDDNRFTDEGNAAFLVADGGKRFTLCIILFNFELNDLSPY